MVCIFWIASDVVTADEMIHTVGMSSVEMPLRKQKHTKNECSFPGERDEPKFASDESRDGHRPRETTSSLSERLGYTHTSFKVIVGIYQ